MLARQPGSMLPKEISFPAMLCLDPKGGPHISYLVSCSMNAGALIGTQHWSMLVSYEYAQHGLSYWQSQLGDTS